MKDFLKGAWRLFADLAGVISTIGLLITASRTIFQQIKGLFSENIYLGLILIVLLGASLVYLVKTFWNNLSEIRQLWNKEKISKKLETKTVNATPLVLKNYIPSDDFLRQVLENSLQEFRVWAHDATISTFNLYIERDGDDVSKTIQIFAISKWSKEKMVIYYPRLSKDIESLDKNLTERDETLFFDFSNWEKAVTFAFERERNRIDNDFIIQISGRGKPSSEEIELYEEMGVAEEVSINISFRSGQRKERVGYKYDGKNLKSEDGDSIEVPLN